MKKSFSGAVVGAGMGGLAVAATLRRVGIEVRVYEQAVRFARIGAGIQMVPNSIKVLRGIGIEEQLRTTSPANAGRMTRDAPAGTSKRLWRTACG
jgi:6-hydroxynicotinate 3-monooxygenase